MSFQSPELLRLSISMILSARSLSDLDVHKDREIQKLVRISMIQVIVVFLAARITDFEMQTSRSLGDLDVLEDQEFSRI